MAEFLRVLQQILNNFLDISVHIVLQMNLDRSKLMFNEHVTPGPIADNGSALEVVQDYVCHEQTLQVDKKYLKEWLTDAYSRFGLNLNYVELSHRLFHRT